MTTIPPSASRRFPAVVLGAAVAMLGDLATVIMFDRGVLPAEGLAYGALCLAPALCAATWPARRAELATLIASALAGTGLFYKFAVQPGIVSQLGNGLDWVLAMLAMAAAMWVLGSMGLAFRGHAVPMREARCRVTLDAHGVTCLYPTGESQSIAWADLSLIQIVTNDTGPWGTDVLWGFHDRSGMPRAIVPGGATGEREMLTVLGHLPGFDEQAVILAMGCTSNARFTVWSGALETAPRVN